MKKKTTVKKKKDKDMPPFKHAEKKPEPVQPEPDTNEPAPTPATDEPNRPTQPEEQEEPQDAAPASKALWIIVSKMSTGKQPLWPNSFPNQKEAEEFIKTRGWGTWAHAVEK